MLTDLRFALRSLLRARGFAVVAILTVALGIGANTAMFSVLNGVVLRPLEYREPERLVTIASKFPGLGFDRFWVSPPEYLELMERARSYSGIAALAQLPASASVTYGETAVRARAPFVTPNTFSVLGISPIRGVAFDSAAGLPGAEPVVMLSYELWQRGFGGVDDMVGKQLMVNGVSTRVVGIMPRGVRVNDVAIELWRPLPIDPSNRQNRGSHGLTLIGRLAPGVSYAAAENELRDLVAGWRNTIAAGHVPTPDNHPLFMTSLHDTLVGSIRPALMVLFGLVAFVLLISCANVGNLLLVRADARQKEIAIRTAMGASRKRLLRQFIVEGVVLSLIGGVVGLALGFGGLKLLLLSAPDSIPRLADIQLDIRVLAFTFVASIATGVVFGLAPLMHVGARRVGLSLREGGQRTTAGAAQRRVQQTLVVSELALAVALVAGAGLMLRSFGELQRVDPGFDSENVVTFQLLFPAAQYAGAPETRAVTERVLEALRAVPGVTSAAAMSGLPPRRDVNANDTEFEGLRPPPDGPPQNVDYWQFVTTDYAKTMGVKVVQGRGFESTDQALPAGGGSVLINERLAEVFYRGESPIGRRLRPPGADTAPWFTIVGVVKDVKQRGVEATTGTELYFHIPQAFTVRLLNFVVRAQGGGGGEPSAILAAATQAVRRVDPTLPIGSPRTMDEVVSVSMARPRFLTLLLGCFAAIALGLAAVGTYGVMAYTVAQRRQEIGVRMALGAQAKDVVGMVFRQAFGVAGLGVAIGVAGAFGVTRLMQGLLYGVSPTDPMAFTAAPLVLAAVAAVACVIPAVRAAKVDPIQALK